METPDPQIFRRFEMEDIDTWEASPLWDEEESKTIYSYPLEIGAETAEREGLRLSAGRPDDQTFRLGRFICNVSKDTHRAAFRWATDFLVPDGTPILAADDGIIIEVVEHNDKFGDGREFRNFMNRITIAHENGEVSQYCHLAKNSVSDAGLEKSMPVKRGQRIGTVGKTGYVPEHRDHLHFVVLRLDKNESPFAFKSLSARFE